MSRDPSDLNKHGLPKRQSTALMQRAVAGLCGLIVLHVSNTRFVLKTARCVARIIRDIIIQEEWNALIAAKSTMLRTPSWRSRVLRDLGGNAALSDWEARDARARAPQPSFIRKTLKHAASKQGENHTLPESQIFYDACKIDQEGQFRLPPHARRTYKRTQAPCHGSAARPTRQMIKNRVIAVFPAEFRAACLQSHPRKSRKDVGRKPNAETAKTHMKHGGKIRTETETGTGTGTPYRAPIRGQP